MRLCACAPRKLTRAEAHWPQASLAEHRIFVRSGLGLAALAQPEALAVQLENVDVVGWPASIGWSGYSLSA